MPSPEPVAKKWPRLLAGVLGLALGLYLFYTIFRGTDLHSILGVLSSLSAFGIALLLLPSTLGAALDAIGWKYLLPERVQRHSLWKIFRVRTASESVVSTVPMGAVIADPLKALLLRRYFGISLASGTASVALRTILLGVSQGLLVFFVSIFSYSWISEVSLQLLGTSALSWLAMLMSAGAVITYSLLIAASAKGSLSSKLQSLLGVIKIKKVQEWVVARASYFDELHNELSSFGTERRIVLVTVNLLYVVMWSMEGIETYIILRLLGAPIPFWSAFALEAICSFIKSIAFVIPSGLGAQDAGYAAFITSAGEAQSVAVGFILIKRARQILWIVIGSKFLFRFRRPQTESVVLDSK